MNRTRRGFTLVEVALFLAITGLLFMGIVAGVQNSIFQQRYNDSVQSFAEFLRSIYSQVSNVQNSTPNAGRSKKAIYGKLIVFGESTDFDNNPIPDTDNVIFSYDVIGNVDGYFSGDILSQLSKMDLNVVADENENETATFVGNVEEYKPRWAAGIQQIGKNNYEKFVGSILVIRHPRSGTIFTLINKSNELQGLNTNKNLFKESVKKTGFYSIDTVDFCVNPNGNQPSDSRRDIRIIKNARNASGVEVINLDDPENNLCNKELDNS